MNPTELATMTVITIQTVLSKQSLEQYVWFAMFLLLCVQIAVSTTDAQIFTVGCVIAGIVFPHTLLILIFVRVVSQIYLLFTNAESTTTKLSFEDMYPDLVEKGNFDTQNRMQSCF